MGKLIETRNFEYAYCPPLIHVKIEITFIAAPAYRALPLKGDAAHIPVDVVIAQTEGAGQLSAAQQFAVLHIGALQNIDPVMPAVGLNFSEFETRVSVEHSADHLVENFKEQRSDDRKLSGSMQTFSVGLYAYSYGFFYQAYGLFAGDVLDHLQINSRPREDHLFGMYLFFLGQIFILVTQFGAKLRRVIDQNIRLLLAELLSQFTQQIREPTELFIISFIDHILCSPALQILICLIISTPCPKHNRSGPKHSGQPR